MLLLANRKCGLSASAALAPITTVVTAEMSTKAMRRIVAPPLSGLSNDVGREVPGHHLPFRRCRAVRTKVRRAMTGPAGKWRRPSLGGARGSARVIPPCGGRFRHRAWRQLPSEITVSRPGNGTARPNGQYIFILAITGRNRIPGMKTSARAVPALSPSVPRLRYTPGSCRGRYHTDRQPGAALRNTAICPAGPPARNRGQPGHVGHGGGRDRARTDSGRFVGGSGWAGRPKI